MSDDLVKQSIEELWEITRCHCHPAYLDRGRHAPECNYYSAEAVRIVADRIKALEAKLATCKKYSDAYLEMDRITREALCRTEDKLAQAAALAEERAKLLPWARLGQAVMEGWPEDFGEIDGFALQDMAEAAGVLVPVEGGFDPEKHSDPYCAAEPGDPWFQIIPCADAIEKEGGA